MKKNLLLLAFSLGAMTMISCSNNEVYETSVTRDMELTLDGKPWNIYYGTSNKPLFIYGEDGGFIANYSTSYRFALPDGSYKMIATTQSDLLAPPTPLSEQTIAQDPLTKTSFAISDPVDYSSGSLLSLPMTTRTGVLRLKSTDVKADKSYSMVRAVMTTPVVAYHVGEARMVVGDPITLVREKESSGGIGYSDDAILLATNDAGERVNLRIDYLDTDGNVVNSKEFLEPVEILPNDTVRLSFELNNPDELVIMNYSISFASKGWTEEKVYPAVAIDIPDGYTYVKPDEDINAVFNQLAADDTVDEIRIFLKANSQYTFNSNTLTACPKAVSIVAQKPGFGQQKTKLNLSAMSMVGNLSEIHFENLELNPGDRFFNLRNQEFNVEDIAFVGCDFNKWNGVMWYQQTNADNQQVVGTVRMEDCSFTNYSAGRSALWGLSTKKKAPVSNWVFRNTLFHGSFGTNTVVLTGLNVMDKPISVLVEGCTFIDTKGTSFTYFDINGAAAPQTDITVRNNTLSGISGAGTWFKLGEYTTLSAEGNSRTKAYTMGTWGVDTPTESTKTYEELLTELNLK